MKKFFSAGVLGVFLLTANIAFANEGFEGIWKRDDIGDTWVGIHVNNGTIIIFSYQPRVISGGIALAGTADGTVARLGFAAGTSVFDATLTLISPTTAIYILNKCVAVIGTTAVPCIADDGVPIHYTKVFD